MTTTLPEILPTLPILPLVISGTPTLTPEKVTVLTTWYGNIFDNYNKTTDPVSRVYSAGAVNVLSDTLRLLHDNPVQDKPLTESVVKVVKSNKWSIKKKIVVIGVVIIIIDGRLPRKAKAILEKKFPIENTKKQEK